MLIILVVGILFVGYSLFGVEEAKPSPYKPKSNFLDEYVNDDSSLGTDGEFDSGGN